MRFSASDGSEWVDELWMPWLYVSLWILITLERELQVNMSYMPEAKMALLARLSEQLINFQKDREELRGAGNLVKSLFLSENRQEKVFLSKGFNFKDSNRVSYIVLSILHPLTAKTSSVTASLIFKYYTNIFERAGKNFALWLLKITLKLLYVLETCFVLNFRYYWKFLGFSCWNIAI